MKLTIQIYPEDIIPGDPAPGEAWFRSTLRRLWNVIKAAFFKGMN